MFDPKKYNQNSTALVVIDMQEAYFNAGELADMRDSFTRSCRKIVDVFRQSERPIIFIRTAHHATSDTWTLNMMDDGEGYLFEGTDDVAFLKELDVQDGDITVTKLRDSAFYATHLQQLLASRHIDTLVIAGISTHSCVMLTAADAYARNLRVVLVDDAIGSHDAKYHEQALELLSQEYRHVRASVDDVAKWIVA